MASRRGIIHSRELGLELGAGVVKFITGRENLHYGLWEDGLEVCAGNLKAAQEAYTAKLVGLLPNRKLNILDIGGGCGETARDLADSGHNVEIVVPSKILAERCESNAGSGVEVHVMRFEEFSPAPRFDVCLFSESFQYIPIDVALTNAAACLREGGEILIADCFRTGTYYEEWSDVGLVGGGHSLGSFREAVNSGSFELLHEEDITNAVAPSVELEQQFYNLIGLWVSRTDRHLETSHPFARQILRFGLLVFAGRRRLLRLRRRLAGNYKNAEAFCRYNRYLICKLKPKKV